MKIVSLGFDYNYPQNNVCTEMTLADKYIHTGINFNGHNI